MKNSDDDLVNRARIAYAKTGAMEQPGESSDVVDVDGADHAVLRNVNGTLAVYKWDGSNLKRLDTWPDSLN